MDRNERTVVRGFLQNLLLKKGDMNDFADTDSLIVLGGRLASADVLELVVFLEEQYKVDFAERGFDVERVDTVNDIMELIAEVKDKGISRRAHAS